MKKLLILAAAVFALGTSTVSADNDRPISVSELPEKAQQFIRQHFPNEKVSFAKMERELFLQIVYGRTQSAFSEGGLIIGAGLEDLGKGLRSQVGTLYGTLAKGPRYLEMAEGYIKTIALDKNDEICGYEFVHMGKFMDEIKKGTDANEALKKVTGTYGRFTAEQGAVKHIDPRHE